MRKPKEVLKKMFMNGVGKKYVAEVPKKKPKTVTVGEYMQGLLFIALDKEFVKEYGEFPSMLKGKSTVDLIISYYFHGGRKWVEQYRAFMSGAEAQVTVMQDMFENFGEEKKEEVLDYIT